MTDMGRRERYFIGSLLSRQALYAYAAGSGITTPILLSLYALEGVQPQMQLWLPSPKQSYGLSLDLLGATVFARGLLKGLYGIAAELRRYRGHHAGQVLSVAREP